MVGNVNREIETLRNTQKKKLEIKNTETNEEYLVRRLDRTVERVSDYEDISKETS